MNFIQLLSDAYFWILALGINMIFVYIKPFIKNFLLKFKSFRKHPERRRSIYRFFLFLFSIFGYYLMYKYDVIKKIENSVILPAFWVSIMSELIYEIGYKTIFLILKEKLQNFLKNSKIENNNE